jgi:hypothetical protein
LAALGIPLVLYLLLLGVQQRFEQLAFPIVESSDREIY